MSCKETKITRDIVIFGFYALDYPYFGHKKAKKHAHFRRNICYIAGVLTLSPSVSAAHCGESGHLRKPRPLRSRHENGSAITVV